jgi:hypothetical protein
MFLSDQSGARRWCLNSRRENSAPWAGAPHFLSSDYMSITLSFHGKPALKREKLSHLRKHRKLEHLTQGVGWESNGHTKGCAIGCLFDKYEHELGPQLIGIPEGLLRLVDHLFEALPKVEAEAWAIDWIAAVPVNVPEREFSRLLDRFQVFWLERQLTQFDNGKFPDVAKAVARTIALLHLAIDDKEPESAAWSAAENAARNAAWSAARNAARSAAWSAAWSAAESAARSAAWSAARSAAWNAARSAARNAAWSAAESAAWSAARSEARAKRDWLLTELKKMKTAKKEAN